MKTKTKNLIIILLLGFSFVFNGYLFIENKNKATTIVQLNKKTVMKWPLSRHKSTFIIFLLSFIIKGIERPQII